MLILGDESQHNGKIPWVTGSLILINLLVFLGQIAIGERFTMGFSLIPAEITEFKDIARVERVKIKVPSHYYFDRHTKQIRTAHEYEYHNVRHYHGPFPIILTLITSMFLHGDWLHLIGNMWFLAIFGRNVECALDHGRFLVFYLACGVAGGLAHVFSDMHSLIPCLGASGAISGIMGGYVSIFPFNKIRMWFGWFIGVIELPAIAVVGIWFLFQYLAAFWELESGVSDGIAYWDHIGGFVAGVAGVWGTIFYLKYQLAHAPENEGGGDGAAGGDDGAASAAASPDGAGEPAAVSQKDDFDAFLPRSDVFGEKPVKLPDPFERIFDERNRRFSSPSSD